MYLRARLDKGLSVRDGEEQLTEEERRFMFRGGYILPRAITEVTLDQNYSPSTRDAYPKIVKIARTREGVHEFNERLTDNQDASILVDNLNTEERLTRANRVERMGRRIKAAAAIVATAAAATMAIAYTPPSSPDRPQQCKYVLGRGDDLESVKPEKVESEQKAGETVCEIAGMYFKLS
jgi:hypothetical protein